MVSTKLKWNKQSFDVEFDPKETVDQFKQKIYDLTGVPKDRQKLMAKKAWVGMLKDDADAASLKLVEGHEVMLMGSAEVVQKPKEAVVFIEDMSAKEMAEKGAIFPAGLVNLGNTCYLNATIECMRHMPEMRQAFKSVSNVNMSSLLRSTFDQADGSSGSISPDMFVRYLRMNFPQFAETNQHGFLQQDAEEFYNTLVNSVKSDLDSVSQNFNSLLGMRVEERLTCEETDGEPAVVSFEQVNKIICNIQGGAGAAVNIDHMHEGVKLGFEGTLEKHSSVLGRNALWKKTARIASLPRYICVQFMRFFWKATPESRDHRGVKCKVLRSVSYPETMDVYELCCEELQKKLKVNRDVHEKIFEASSSIGLPAKRVKTEEATVPVPPPPTTTTAAALAAAADVDPDMDPEELKALNEAMQLSLTPPVAPKDDVAAPSFVSIGDGLPEGFSGLYELHGIVSHKGRSADSGHYIGWVRQAPGSDMWWCYDDAKVTEVRTDSILLLKGGGDRDMAYLTFYRFKDGSK